MTESVMAASLVLQHRRTFGPAPGLSEWADVLAHEVLRIHEPDEALHVRVRLAISDPGAFCVRGGHVLDQEGNLQDDPDWAQDWNGRPKYESISSWGARAVLIVLRDPS